MTPLPGRCRGDCRGSCASRWNSCWGFPESSGCAAIDEADDGFELYTVKTILLVLSPHSVTPSNPHKHPTHCQCQDQTPSPSCFRDKKDPAHIRRCDTVGSLSANIPRSSSCRDGLKLTPAPGASLIFIAFRVKELPSSLPLCWVAYSLENAIQRLGGAARCQSKDRARVGKQMKGK